MDGSRAVIALSFPSVRAVVRWLGRQLAGVTAVAAGIDDAARDQVLDRGVGVAESAQNTGGAGAQRRNGFGGQAEPAHGQEAAGNLELAVIGSVHAAREPELGVGRIVKEG